MAASFWFKAASLPVSRYNRALTTTPENPKREIRQVKKQVKNRVNAFMISFRRAGRQQTRQNIWNQVGPNCRKRFGKEARRDSLPARFPEERHCEHPR
jgi:hypothetical protein